MHTNEVLGFSQDDEFALDSHSKQDRQQNYEVQSITIVIVLRRRYQQSLSLTRHDPLLRAPQRPCDDIEWCLQPIGIRSTGSFLLFILLFTAISQMDIWTSAPRASSVRYLTFSFTGYVEANDVLFSGSLNFGGSNLVL